MTTNLGRAFGRLSRAGPKPFPLLPGLRLTPTSEWNATVAKTTTPRPKGPTLIDSVTDVLKTHKLEWVIGPGLQISLYADDKGLFKIEAGNDNSTQGEFKLE
ncbi:hypothetical protein O3M35_010330 [Rhynocoris fuscipes]|uniref:Uncharacterized protein n=1 Tax=Rhynocoris fuscipes TaxID=488301 RepID=A0AAW1D4N7_9HEMI